MPVIAFNASSAEDGYQQVQGYLSAKAGIDLDITKSFSWKKGWIKYHLDKSDDYALLELIRHLHTSFGV